MLGYALGYLGYFAMGSKSLIIYRNYRNLGFGPLKAAWYSPLCVANYGKLMTEFMTLGFFSRQRIFSWGVANEELLKRAVSAGKGVVLATFHFGNWDLAGCSMSVRDYPLAVIADRVGNNRINNYVISSRQAKGMRVIPTGSAASSIGPALDHGEAVAFLVDRPVAKGGIEVNFGAGKLRIPKGAFHYARQYGSKLLIGYALRKAFGRFEPTVACEIPVPHTHDEAAGLRQMAQQVMSVYYDLVRAHPAQWYMFRSFGSAA